MKLTPQERKFRSEMRSKFEYAELPIKAILPAGRGEGYRKGRIFDLQHIAHFAAEETDSGYCGNPDGSWPLVVTIEETDEYKVMACDAGCMVVLTKKPPHKHVIDKAGNLVDANQKQSNVPII